MIHCSFTPGKILQIAYNESEDFQKLEPEYFFLCHIISGYVTLIINGERFSISSGALLAFPKNTAISVLACHQLQARSISFSPQYINDHLSWEYIESKDYVFQHEQFDYPSFDPFYKRNEVYNGILPLDCSNSQTIREIMNDVILQLKYQPNKLWSCNARTSIFSLLNLVEYFQQHYMQGDIGEITLEHQILDYLHLNICSQINITALCEQFHTSHSTLNRRFKDFTGYSVSGYIMKKRIELAKHALSVTSIPIEELAYKYGFHDVSYFIRIFKKYVGLTPLQYRNRQFDTTSCGTITVS